MKIIKILVVSALFIFVGCSRVSKTVVVNTSLDLDQYSVVDSDNKKIVMPECKKYFENSKIKVIVLSVGNTVYDKFLTSTFKKYLLSIGGVEVLPNSGNKIEKGYKLEELKKLGKANGARYVIVSDLFEKYYYKLDENGHMSKHVDVDKFTKKLEAYIPSDISFYFNTTMKFRIVDIKSGKSFYLDNVYGKYLANRSDSVLKNNHLDIAAVKRGIQESVLSGISDNLDMLNGYFPVYGYVMESRLSSSGKQVVKVNLGKNYQIDNGDILRVFNYKVVTDSKTGRKVCKIEKTPTRLVVTNDIQNDYSWAKVVIDSFDKIKKIPVNSIVGREKQEN